MSPGTSLPIHCPTATHHLYSLPLNHPARSRGALLSEGQQRPSQLDQGGGKHRGGRQGASRLHSGWGDMEVDDVDSESFVNILSP